jgi:ferredoxin
MKELQNKAAEWLENGTVNLLIGFCEDLGKRPVPCFIEQASETGKLIFNPDCRNNLSVYLHKPEVKQAQKIGLVGNIATLRSLLQLKSENQLWSLQLSVLTVDAAGQLVELLTTEELETYVQTHFPPVRPEVEEMLEKLHAMSKEERWAYWKDQLTLCVKCYDCRAVCPLCYCTQCTVECNQPQWIKLSSETSGNFEWHTMRAMHLAGRCVECGECGRVCPAGIPVHLLTAEMNREIEQEFGSKTGFSAKGGYALNSFKPDDKENFIK